MDTPAFRWWADDGPLIIVFGPSLPSSTKKNVVKFGPRLTKLIGSMHELCYKKKYLEKKSKRYKVKSLSLSLCCKFWFQFPNIIYADMVMVQNLRKSVFMVSEHVGLKTVYATIGVS